LNRQRKSITWTQRPILLILSLDTTSRAGSIAVVRDDAVLADITGDPAITHGQRLPGDLMRALEAAGVGVDRIDLLAVAVGPGSFTGLRVGIATLQGLASARGLRIVPVSSLEALAREAARTNMADALIAPWVDGQRGEVFASLYAPDAGSIVEAPVSATPAETLRAWRSALGRQPVIFTGDGAVRYRDAISATLGGQPHILEPVPALAAPVARIAAREPHRAVLPHAVVPVYVRRPDADLARDRRRMSGT
jgi:tRNA threonylcarbamoyladenosine biosynthesis protein TsaB